MYIIMDLDQTLLRADHSISDYSFSVLQACRKKGHLIVFNTARSYLSSLKYIKDVKPDYAILNGGALIVKNNATIYENCIKAETCNEVINIIQKHNIKEFSLEGQSGLFTNNKNYPKDNPLATFFDFTKPFLEDTYKILFSTTLDKLALEIATKYQLEVTHYLGGTWYRLAKTNKHHGNLALYNLLKDENPLSICFGDDIGDLEMLKGSSIGVALSNSQKSVLANVTKITKHTNDDNGVAHYLDDMLRSGRL